MTQIIKNNEKISVLYIIDSFLDLAGAERNLFEIVTRIDKNKFRPLVFVLQEGSERLVELLNKEGILSKNLKLKRIYGFKGFIEIFKSIHFINKNKVKIVVTYHEGSDFWGSIIAKFSGVPIIISSRRDMGYKLSKRHIIAYKFINRLFDKILVVSDAVKDIIFEREGVLWSKMLTIYNGVDLQKFSKVTDNKKLKNDLGLNLDWPVIGIIAGLRPIKGHKYFLEAAALVLKEFPNTSFLIVGWNFDNNYFGELKNIVNDLRLQNNVIFTGGRSDTNSLLSIIDIFVLASINEGFSNAIIEAMAAGKPIVATNSGGTNEAIQNRVHGILVPPKDSAAIASSIVSIIQDVALARKLSFNARRQAEDKFDVCAMVKNIECLYSNLLSKGKIRDVSFSEINVRTLKQAFYKIFKSFLGIVIFCLTLFIRGNNFLIKKGRLIILTYHRVNDEDFDPLEMNIRIEDFERQMRYLKNNFNIISLEKAVKSLREGIEIPQASIVVTFDDGYEDNYTNAFPILRKYNIPATIFLSVSSIEKRKLLWFDLIIWAIKTTNKKEVDLRNLNLPTYRLETIFNKKLAIKKIIEYCKHISKIELNIFIEEILTLLEIDREQLESNCPMLDWEEINKMRNENIIFGNHGFDHSILTNLTQAELEIELRLSNETLAKKLGSSSTFFSYPNGSIEDFNQVVKDMLIGYGYQASLSLINGVNESSFDLYALKRLCITKGMYLDFLNNFSEKLFFIHLSGIFYSLKDSLFFKRSFANRGEA